MMRPNISPGTEREMLRRKNTKKEPRTMTVLFRLVKNLPQSENAIPDK